MQDIIYKTCKIHGINSKFFKRSDSGYRCSKCSSSAVSRRRKALKERAVDYMGGACSRCGYSKCYAALEFHHKDGGKDFGISQKGFCRSWERIVSELKKCIMLCSNCHREEHHLTN